MEAEKESLIAWTRKFRPPNTTKTYSTYAKQYLRYTEQRNLPPQSDISLGSFMRHALEDRNLARSTITKTIPSAVKDIFRFHEQRPHLHTELIKQISKVIVARTKPAVQKLPLLEEHIQKLCALVQPTFESVRNFFVLLMMMMAMLRESELANLMKQDVWVEIVNEEACLFILVEMSKTDQGREGHTIVLSSNVKMPWLCPVRWWCLYVGLRAQHDYFFHTMRTNSAAERRLANSTPNHILKEMLESIGVDSRPYGSHSCRRGGVTAAVAKGVEILLVARHGNWKSSAIFLYVTDSIQRKLSVSKAIFG